MSELTSNAIVVGDASDDTLSGGSFAGSIMHGQNGADSMTGGFGDDTLIGAAGDDILEGGGGADVLYGGIGDDFLIYGADSLQGGGPEMVRMFGGEGQDALFLNFSNDVLSNPDLLLEIKDYSLALQAGEDPGDGGEYAFENFALRVSSVEVVFLFIDGQAFDPALPPVPVAFDDAFTMADNAPLDGDVEADVRGRVHFTHDVGMPASAGRGMPSGSMRRDWKQSGVQLLSVGAMRCNWRLKHLRTHPPRRANARSWSR